MQVVLCRGEEMAKDIENQSDELLCSLASSGDDEAMAELIKRIMPLAAAKAQMYSHPDLNSEDLIQEGMFGFLTALNTYNPDKNASFKTYAGVCINNRIKSMLRRSSSKKTIPHDIVSSIWESDEDIRDYSTDPQEIMTKSEDAKALKGLLDEKLSELEKSVLNCRLKGMNYEEIANALSISTKSVDNALMRIRRKLNEEK